jgi:hypothetical protein
MALCNAWGPQRYSENVSSGFHQPASGPKCTQTFSITLNPVSNANNTKNQLQSCNYSNLCRGRTNQISGFMRTYLDQSSLLDINTNTSCASQMPSPNTHWSRQWRTKKCRQWPRPFSLNGFVNSASQGKFTPTAGRTLSISSQTSLSRYSMLTTLRKLWPILSATHRLRSLTKKPLLWMTPHLTGKTYFQHSCSATK